MVKVSQSSEICLSYNLFDLPTAQHKAGLAGLLLLIDSMQQRGLGPLPVVDNLTATSVELTLTQAAMQTVFDDLYDAELRETSSKKKWKKKKKEIPPKREEVVETIDSKTGKVKRSKLFIYDAVVPKVSFLEHHYPGEENSWLKLWREMIWDTLRGVPTTRGIYEERAEGKPSEEAVGSWKDLSKFFEKFKKGELLVGDVKSSLFLGAQEVNAERVPFNGRVDQNFLLHFWPLTVQIFVPQLIKRDEKGQFKQEFGDKEYVIAIPEVNDLEEFCDIFSQFLANLDPQLRGYRPKASIIDIPAEGGLEFLRHLTDLARQKAKGGNIKYSVSAVELFHLEKQDKVIKMWAADRIVPRIGLLDQYEGIHAFCRNPFFKSQRLLNLLREFEWYEGFTHQFAIYPWEFFVHSEKTPTSFSFFSSDIRK